MALLPRGAISTSTRSPHLALGRYMKAIALARGDVLGALAAAEGAASRWRDTPEVVTTLRAAVDAMTTDNTGGLADPAIASFLLPALRANPLFDRMNFVRVPINVQFPAFSADATGYSNAEGTTKAFSRFSTQTLSVEPKKVSAAVAFNRELIQMANSDAEAFMGQQLLAAADVRLDRALTDPSIAGSIASGAVTITSSGITTTALAADRRSALLAVGAAGNDALLNAAWIMGTRLATHYCTLLTTTGALAYPAMSVRGGFLDGLPCYVSGTMSSADSPSESHCLLVDQNAIFVGDAGAAVTHAESASVQLDDGPAAGATTLRSLWQANMIALRAERFIGFQRRTMSSVAVINGIQV